MLKLRSPASGIPLHLMFSEPALPFFDEKTD